MTARETYDTEFNETKRREYTLNGSQIVKETYYYSGYDYDEGYDGTAHEAYSLVYIYDETGAPIGIEYRTPSYAANVYDCYFFEKNLQGDIIAIYNASGTKIVTYTYDAWGNVTTTPTSGITSGQSTVAYQNPFRYRGYYYDTHLGMYYLQSRYYNPEWGRFLNGDATGLLGVDGTLLSYNLFAYCKNNPVMGYDPFGYWSVDLSLTTKVLITTATVALCLTGVGAIAATAATIVGTSVAAAVTLSVATAAVATAVSAIDGAVCAELSGGEWYDGAMAGAIGGSSGTLVSSLTNPEKGSDAALRLNVLGRFAGSFVYDFTYDLFSSNDITLSSLGLYTVDATMDAVYSCLYYYYTPNICNDFLRTSLNGLIDSCVDVFQGLTFFAQ